MRGCETVITAEIGYENLVIENYTRKTLMNHFREFIGTIKPFSVYFPLPLQAAAEAVLIVPTVSTTCFPRPIVVLSEANDCRIPPPVLCFVWLVAELESFDTFTIAFQVRECILNYLNCDHRAN